jgi:hydroxyacylglutathione hydrolase
MPIHVKKFTFNDFQENTYVLYVDSGDCLIIDAGCYSRSEQNELLDFLKLRNLRPLALLNTHCHIDHVLGNYFLKNKLQIPLRIPRHDEPTLRAVPLYAPMWGFPDYQAATADSYIEDGEKISLGEEELEVLFTPGHAPGHIVFYHRAGNFCINGDVLFRGSVGRTDLPGGNSQVLLQSIHKKLFTLPDSTVVYCGHGSETTIGFEKLHNPFCALRK